MPLVTTVLGDVPPELPRVTVAVDRHTLAKRRWRATARDGTDLAVALDAPCAHGDCLHATDTAGYLVEQTEEAVIDIPLPTEAPAAARLGWFLGNQHLPVEVRDDVLRLEASPHLAALLTRHAIVFSETRAVFRPPAHSAGHNHSHGHTHSDGSGLLQFHPVHP